MHRMKTVGIYAAICIVAAGIGLFVASIFGSDSSLPVGYATTVVTSVAQPAAQVSTPTGVPATSEPTTPPEPTGAPTSLATPAEPTAAPTTPPATPTTAATAAAITAATAAPTRRPTVAPTTAEPTEPAPTADSADYIEYTVQPGDILSRIAKRYGVTLEEILAINDIENPASLTVGQVLRIPKK
jgi:LysM repeat protein